MKRPTRPLGGRVKFPPPTEAAAASQLKCVLYARVSSKEQAEGFSISAQMQLLRGYAKSHQFAIVSEFTEAETAKRAGRTAFREMLSFLSKHPEVKGVLVEKTDRLYRNFHDYVLLNFEEMGLEIHLVKENEILSKGSRSHQKFIHGIKVLMAKNYVDNLSEEVVKGLDEKAKQGLWPSYAPIGYRNVASNHAIEPDHAEATVVRRAFELVATGQYTLQRLRQELFADGLRSRRARKMLGKEALRRILTNPIYAGSFIWNGVTYQGKHEPLISIELFERVQDVLGLKSKPRKTKHSFAFTGMIKCGNCGCAITAEYKKGGKYIYYRCSAQCDGVVYLPEAVLARQMGEALRRIELTSEIVNWTREGLLESRTEQVVYHEAALARLQTRKAKLASYLDQAYVDRVEGRLSTETWMQRSAEWEAEREEVNRQLAVHERAQANYLAAGVKLIELAQVAYTLYVSRNPRQQRRLLDFVLSNCVLVGRSVRYDFRLPFSLMADVTEFQVWRGGRDLNDSGPIISQAIESIEVSDCDALTAIEEPVGEGRKASSDGVRSNACYSPPAGVAAGPENAPSTVGDGVGLVVTGAAAGRATDEKGSLASGTTSGPDCERSTRPDPIAECIASSLTGWIETSDRVALQERLNEVLRKLRGTEE